MMAKKIKKRKDSSQGWLMTFTDMLMLLVVMFVLFLSFSEIESDSFKQNAGAISEAFNQPPPTSILEGSSAIVDLSDTNIDFDTRGKDSGFKKDNNITENNNESSNIPKEKSPDTEGTENNNKSSNIPKEKSPDTERMEKPNRLETVILESMDKEIKKGKMQLIKKDNVVILRFPEKVTFNTGSSDLNQDIAVVLDRLTNIVNGVGGINKIVVAGHTDSVPISNEKFRSNWDLSASRAVSVVHRVLENKSVDKRMVLAVGSADTEPVFPNDTASNRAANRRVEIKIELKK